MIEICVKVSKLFLKPSVVCKKIYQMATAVFLLQRSTTTLPCCVKRLILKWIYLLRKYCASWREKEENMGALHAHESEMS